VVEVGEDLQGAPPTVAGKGVRTRFVVVIPQVHQSVPFVKAIPDLAIQVDGLLITGYRFLMTAKPLMRVAEAAPAAAANSPATQRQPTAAS